MPGIDDGRSATRALGLVVAATAILLFLRPGVPLLDPDESRFARTSVEMLRAREVVVPLFEGQPRLVKPPLLHWLQIAGFSSFGVHEWVARLPSALAMLGLVALTGWIGLRRFGGEAGAWAAAVVATMPLVIAGGRIGTVDALLAVHVLAVVALDVAAPPASQALRPWAYGALLGLGFLAKGPVGVFLPLLLLLAGRTAAGRELLPSAHDLVRAVAGWGVVVLPWGLAFAGRVGWDRVAGLLWEETGERYLAGSTHAAPAWYYLEVLPVALLPWIGIVLLAAGRLVARGRRGSPTARYAAGGLVVGLVFFSLGRDKLPTYLLPLAPLAALLVTWELGEELKEPARRTAGPALLAATLAGVALAFGLGVGLQADPLVRQLALAGVGLHGIGAIVAALAVQRPRRAYAAAAATSGAFLLLAVVVLHPALGQRRSAAVLLRVVPELAGPAPVVTVDMRVPSLTYYRDRPAEIVPMSGLEARVAAPDRPFFVFAEVDWPAVPPAARERLVERARQGKYRILREPEGDPQPLPPTEAPGPP